MMEIKALFFDLFGTVFNWRDCLEAALQTFSDKRNLSIDVPACVARWHALYVEETGHLAAKQHWQPLEEILLRNTQQLIAEYNLSTHDDDAKLLVKMWQELKLWPDSRAAIQELRNIYPCIVMSNASFSIALHLSRSARIDWDILMGADLARQFKPHPKVYLSAASALRLRPDQCCMVASHNMDLRAAADLNFQTAFISRPDYLRTVPSDEEPAADWDYCAQDLAAFSQQLLACDHSRCC